MERRMFALVADDNPGKVVVASSDSDMLFHGEVLLRKDPRKHTFSSYFRSLHRCDAEDKHGVLDQYCAQMAVSSSRYEMTKQIFIDKSETMAGKGCRPDPTMRELVNSVSIYIHG
ncbi:hypothetical protein BGZ65_009937, partial [Modicella reniformis]